MILYEFIYAFMCHMCVLEYFQVVFLAVVHATGVCVVLKMTILHLLDISKL